MTKRIAVVLFNLGGPDTQKAVRQFLYNLFNDPAIINLPFPFRPLLASMISNTRAKEAKANYMKMGGGSPIMPETVAQADALEKSLSTDGIHTSCFPAMRYWHPFIKDVVAEVNAFEPDHTVLLPLYPQFSTTTTGSSMAEWKKAGGGDAIEICCYPTVDGLARAHADMIVEAWRSDGSPDNVRVLFSAHGLPEQIIKKGDPYQFQVERTVEKIVSLLDSQNWEHQICYQSKVGPLKWIGPSTEDAIRTACTDGRAIIVCPVAFVSEHIETLIELDDEYSLIARKANAVYIRSATPRIHPEFIGALASLVRSAVNRGKSVPLQRFCPAHWTQCPRTRQLST